MSKIIMFVFVLFCCSELYSQDECFNYNIGIKINTITCNFANDYSGPDYDLTFILKFYDNRTNPKQYFSNKEIIKYYMVNNGPTTITIHGTKNFISQHFSNMDISPQFLGVEFVFYGEEGDDNNYHSHNCSCTKPKLDDGCVYVSKLFNNLSTNNLNNYLSNTLDLQYLIDFSKYNYINKYNNSIYLENNTCGNYNYSLNYDLSYEVYSPDIYIKKII
jgi:hypothetical protein